MSDIHTLLSAGVVVVVIDLAIRLVALIVIPRDRLPTAAMAWLLAIFFIPVIGVVLFLLIGNPKAPGEATGQAERDGPRDRRESTQAGGPSAKDGWPVVAGAGRDADPTMTSMPIVGGNSAHLLADYEGSLAAMAEDIDAATSYVHVEFYILSLDATTAPFFDALERDGRTRRDGAGAARPLGVVALPWLQGDHRSALTAMGVYWQLMLPVQPLKGRYQRLDLRNHRKLLVVDGQVAFVGSQNLIDRSYNKKKPKARAHVAGADVPLEGPVAGSIDLVFVTDWFSETEGPPRHDVGGPATGPRPPPREARSTARWCRAGRASTSRTTSCCS